MEPHYINAYRNHGKHADIKEQFIMPYPNLQKKKKKNKKGKKKGAPILKFLKFVYRSTVLSFFS